MKLSLLLAVVLVAGASLVLAQQPSIGPDHAAQHYGYITVNGTDTNGAHLFYWMFESRNDPANDPVVSFSFSLFCNVY